MKKPGFFFILFGFCALWMLGCDAIQAIAPPPPPTPVPSPTIAISTATALPTLGALEHLNAAYCMESHIDENEYNLIRFYPSGVVLDLIVQGYNSCEEAWEKTAPYLAESNTDRFSHGEYQFSGTQIQFTLSPAKSNEVAGNVVGRYEGKKMFLKRQGAEEWEYLLVFGGKQP